jgi:glycosyltransferase involved in cell wall biosynthesis
MTIVMMTTSYPRFPGDTIGTFMEPIAHGIAARGHDVHVVLPWHPLLRRKGRDGGITFHPFRYAPHPSLNVFGYAGALQADVRLRRRAWVIAPLALAAGIRALRRVVRQVGATIVHGHWVVPGGAMAMLAARRLPLVLSLHGSDVFVAERHELARRTARRAFARAGWTTACSANLRDRAIELGLRVERSSIIPYGVDSVRFAPDAVARAEIRRQLQVEESTPLVFAAGRFVRKKGFEYLIDATRQLVGVEPRLQLVLAGGGDLRTEYESQARASGIGDRVRFVGTLSQNDVARYLAAADVAVVPSAQDEAGNVDGLPNVVLESLASGTPVVASPAGGIGSVVRHDDTGWLVPERDVERMAAGIHALLQDRARGTRLAERARAMVVREFGWARVAEQFEDAYSRAREQVRRGF